MRGWEEKEGTKEGRKGNGICWKKGVMGKEKIEWIFFRLNNDIRCKTLVIHITQYSILFAPNLNYFLSETVHAPLTIH